MKTCNFSEFDGQGKARYKLILLVEVKKKIRFVLLTVRVKGGLGLFFCLNITGFGRSCFLMEVLRNPLEALVYYKGNKLEAVKIPFHFKIIVRV